MTILLYDYCELEERVSRHLRIWKAWHIILYTFAAIFGILNFTFLQNTMHLVDNNCVLYPRQLEFHMIELPNDTDNEVNRLNDTFQGDNDNATKASSPVDKNVTDAQTATDAVPNENKSKAEIVKRDVEGTLNETVDESQITITVDNVTTVVENKTHRLVLDTSRTLFGIDSDCQFAEYMPMLSTVFAIVWLTFFTMCPGGGRSRSGLRQPWRILAPALLFAVVLVGLTGRSFTQTNGGLHAFCAAFHNVTNATTCSPVNPFLERSWNLSWGIGGRVAATRAASAGAWASWACAAALLLARCLAVPDFVVRRTGVYLTKDPQQKIIPHLKKSPRSVRSTQSSPTKRETASMRSDPTVTTELVTASVEQAQDSAPTSALTSVMATPERNQREDIIEMTYSPQERFQHQR